MRIDPNIFDSGNADLAKEPRYVVGIDFDGSITYITSHDGIASVPGAPIENALTNISATTQTLNPDKANATVGTMSFSMIDEASAFTDLARTKLDSNIGLKGRNVTFHYGFEGDDFTDFVLFQTQVIRSAQTKGGFYQILCADIQRETKTRIFERAQTFLTSSITDAATTIPVLDLSGFEGNNHGTSYSDAPSANVIYIKIDQTKEIIRCPVSGISGNDFTGVTRGALSTNAKAVEVDTTLPSDRRPQVQEYVYLELPAVKLAYAILTGDIEGTADVLPSGWHADVDPALVRLTDFTGIGDDLWDTNDDTLGLVVRFEGLDEQDAKRFLETEVYLLLGLFSPVYADGQLGLKRMVPSLADSPYVTEINNNNVTGHSNMKHDMESVLNNIRIDWNWNGTRFIRSTIFADSTSIARHGTAPSKRLGFRGLAGTRFTEGLIAQLITSLRDMYTGPPLRLDVSGFHSLNQLEIGDPVRVDLTGIRDFSNTPANLQRTMVIHGMTVNWMQGVNLKLFGSSERLTETSPTADTSVLPPAFYPSQGTALSTIPGLLTGDVTNAGTFTLTGASDMNAAGSIFYHDNPLTISSTTTIIIENNVQLRVNGFLTINGTIDGIEQGHPGGTDTNIIDSQWGASTPNLGVPGFIGNSWSHGGIQVQPVHTNIVNNNTGFFTLADFDAFPNIITQVDDSGSGSISGIPTDMRGGGAAAGGRIVERNGGFKIKTLGGDGGDGGAGLCIVSRGGDFGVSGAIDLSGGDGVENNTPFVLQGHNFYAGTGGGGAPGALLWLLDGASVTFPDLLGKFTAITGEVQVDFPIDLPIFLTDANFPADVEGSIQPDRRISLFDHSGTNFRIQFLAADDTPTDDQDTEITAPTGLVATAVFEGVQLDWTNPPQEILSTVEIHASDEDVRSTAVIIAEVSGSVFVEVMRENPRTRFYWVRAVDVDGNVSDFEPDTSTTTATAAPRAAGTNIIIDADFDKSTGFPGGGFWGRNVKQGSSPSQTGALNFIAGGGANSSNAVDLIWSGGTGAATDLNALRRHRINHGLFQFRIRYQTIGTQDSLGHPILPGARRYSVETGGTASAVGSGPFTLPRSVGSWNDVVLHFDAPDAPTLQYFAFQIQMFPISQSLDTLRIDSIFVYAAGEVFGVQVFDGDVQPGVVPKAASADSTKFLKGDASWSIPNEMRDGVTLKVFDPTNTDAVEVDHDGTTGFITQSGGDNIDISPGVGVGHLSMHGASLGDDVTGTFTLPTARPGGFLFLTASSTSNTMTGEFAILYVDDATSITVISSASGSISVGNGSNPDVDGDINIWSATIGIISVKNRRGGTRRIQITVMSG